MCFFNVFAPLSTSKYSMEKLRMMDYSHDGNNGADDTMVRSQERFGDIVFAEDVKEGGRDSRTTHEIRQHVSVGSGSWSSNVGTANVKSNSIQD
ncbi:hypothetical protein BGZ93_003735 [Podila epicladia]|nr:hypothetical protein BGZ93_003735 [Podila epicladia]